MGPFEAVIFDCDGVLADSEPASVAAWTAAIGRFGHQVTDTEVGAFIGKTERDLAIHYAPLVGTSVESMEGLAREEFLALISVEGIRAFQDARALLDMVESAAVPFAVGSNSPRWRLDAVLAAAGLASRFAISVAGDEVAHPKPAADVYLKAAALLDVEPRRCVVIEDTPTGIEAATAAGCSVIAVDRGTVDRLALALADIVVDRLHDGDNHDS